MNETRNMLVESARIARGEIQAIKTVSPADIDALIIPGGSGNVKNLTDWAFNGPDGTILPEVKLLLVNMHNVGKPIAGLCVSPVVIAQALSDSNCSPSLTIGTTKAASPFSIDSFNKGLKKSGAQVVEKSITEIQIDKVNRIVTAPCYMMNASIVEIRNNISQAVQALITLID
jgi:enhancing lycopene biosynthesis protein 2